MGNYLAVEVVDAATCSSCRVRDDDSQKLFSDTNSILHESNTQQSNLMKRPDDTTEAPRPAPSIPAPIQRISRPTDQGGAPTANPLSEMTQALSHAVETEPGPLRPTLAEGPPRLEHWSSPVVETHEDKPGSRPRRHSHVLAQNVDDSLYIRADPRPPYTGVRLRPVPSRPIPGPLAAPWATRHHDQADGSDRKDSGRVDSAVGLLGPLQSQTVYSVSRPNMEMIINENNIKTLKSLGLDHLNTSASPVSPVTPEYEWDEERFSFEDWLRSLIRDGRTSIKEEQLQSLLKLGGADVGPAQVAALTDEDLRTAGISAKLKRKSLLNEIRAANSKMRFDRVNIDITHVPRKPQHKRRASA